MLNARPELAAGPPGLEHPKSWRLGNVSDLAEQQTPATYQKCSQATARVGE
jgi:hypothetical protein